MAWVRGLMHGEKFPGEAWGMVYVFPSRPFAKQKLMKWSEGEVAS